MDETESNLRMARVCVNTYFLAMEGYDGIKGRFERSRQGLVNAPAGIAQEVEADRG